MKLSKITNVRQRMQKYAENVRKRARPAGKKRVLGRTITYVPGQVSQTLNIREVFWL
jgi:hypothetical protein